jgi:cyanophycin synthetase
LLRGIGYESSDVGVFLNVSADHLGLHGVTRIETLARVKGTVVQTVRKGGVAVLNADDPLVLEQANDLHAEVMLFSQEPDNAVIREHAKCGGRYLIRKCDSIEIGEGVQQREFVRLANVPITYAGAARHMVENTLAASAAALAIGIPEAAVREGLATFTPDPSHNAGRLNIFEIDGRQIVVDYAHNESGLTALIEFAKRRFPERSSITAIIGTAGDRGDDVFRGLGKIAAHAVDRVILKRNPGYLRGREPEELIALMLEGMSEAGAEHKLAGQYNSEYEATFAELATPRYGDVLVIMCVEDFRSVIDRLQSLEQ